MYLTVLSSVTCMALSFSAPCLANGTHFREIFIDIFLKCCQIILTVVNHEA